MENNFRVNHAVDPFSWRAVRGPDSRHLLFLKRQKNPLKPPHFHTEADPKPGQESSPPPESPPAPPQPRIVEKTLPQPEITKGVSPQPDKKEGPQTPASICRKNSSNPHRKANALLNPAVPEDARIIQTRLAELGFYDLPIDGIWGKGSRTALMAFKEKNSLGSSDTWDNETQTLLLRETKLTIRPVQNQTKHPISSGSIILDPSEPPDAKKIQARLAELGLYEGTIDGIWGKGSRAGLRLFKEEHVSQESGQMGQGNPDAPVSRNQPVGKRIRTAGLGFTRESHNFLSYFR